MSNNHYLLNGIFHKHILDYFQNKFRALSMFAKLRNHGAICGIASKIVFNSIKCAIIRFILYCSDLNISLFFLADFIHNISQKHFEYKCGAVFAIHRRG